MTIDIFSSDELPSGMEYPRAFRRTVERGLLYFEPWFILEGGLLRDRFNGLQKRYPDRELVPFARREDDDDVACFDPSLPDAVVIIHDFASAGWEQRAILPCFADWLRLALEDMISFDSTQESRDA